MNYLLEWLKNRGKQNSIFHAHEWMHTSHQLRRRCDKIENNFFKFPYTHRWARKFVLTRWILVFWVHLQIGWRRKFNYYKPWKLEDSESCWGTVINADWWRFGKSELGNVSDTKDRWCWEFIDLGDDVRRVCCLGGGGDDDDAESSIGRKCLDDEDTGPESCL